MEKSNLEFHSFGLCAEDKVSGSLRAKIILTEINFVNPTSVESIEETEELSFSKGEATDTVTVTKGNSITAKWWKFNSNRVTPPDLKKDDEVMVFRLGKTDIYFWMDLNQANVKRTENVVFAFAADPKHQMADDLSNAYVINVDTESGHMTIRTSMSNGEKASYLVQLNTRDGTALLRDDRGNGFYINTLENDLGFENANRSKININKEEAFIYAKTRIKLETTKFEVIDKQYVHTSNTWTAKSPGGYNHDCGGYVMTSTSATFSAAVKMPDTIYPSYNQSSHSHWEKGDGQKVSTPVAG